MSRTGEIEQEERERREAQSERLQHWERELRALAQQMWDEDRQNGWHARYLADPYMHALVTIDGTEFARFSRDEAGIIGVFGNDEPKRFATRQDAFDAAVKRRLLTQG